MVVYAGFRRENDIGKVESRAENEPIQGSYILALFCSLSCSPSAPSVLPRKRLCSLSSQVIAATACPLHKRPSKPVDISLQSSILSSEVQSTGVRALVSHPSCAVPSAHTLIRRCLQTKCTSISSGKKLVNPTGNRRRNILAEPHSHDEVSLVDRQCKSMNPKQYTVAFSCVKGRIDHIPCVPQAF